jgi:hypothetical protein
VTEENDYRVIDPGYQILYSFELRIPKKNVDEANFVCQKRIYLCGMPKMLSRSTLRSYQMPHALLVFTFLWYY